MNRSTPLERHTSLKRGSGLKRRKTQFERGSTRLKHGPLGHCTEAQKERVGDLACIVCGEHAGDCHPAHVIPRAVLPRKVADDPRAVVPLCFECHRLYDNDEIDLSSHLEPRWRDSQEWATGAVGLWRAVRYITGTRALSELAEKALVA
jgi:hypothetical protein